MDFELIVNIVVSAGAFLGGAYILDGVYIKGFKDALIVAIIVALLHGLVGWFVGWLFYGLLQFLLDAVVIWAASLLFKDFQVRNFITAIFLAVVVFFLNMLAHQILDAVGI